MAGASVKLNIKGAQEIERRLKQISKNAYQLDTAFRDVGEHLIITHQERWQLQKSPDGTAWKPLSEKTLERKKRGEILIESAALRDELTYQTTSLEMRFGTNKIYGATHQFGDETRNIPQRKFLGLTVEDKQVIIDILGDYIIK